MAPVELISTIVVSVDKFDCNTGHVSRVLIRDKRRDLGLTMAGRDERDMIARMG